LESGFGQPKGDRHTVLNADVQSGPCIAPGDREHSLQTRWPFTRRIEALGCRPVSRTVRTAASGRGWVGLFGQRNGLEIWKRDSMEPGPQLSLFKGRGTSGGGGVFRASRRERNSPCIASRRLRCGDGLLAGLVFWTLHFPAGEGQGPLQIVGWGEKRGVAGPGPGDCIGMRIFGIAARLSGLSVCSHEGATLLFPRNTLWGQFSLDPKSKAAIAELLHRALHGAWICGGPTSFNGIAVEKKAGWNGRSWRGMLGKSIITTRNSSANGQDLAYSWQCSGSRLADRLGWFCISDGGWCRFANMATLSLRPTSARIAVMGIGTTSPPQWAVHRGTGQAPRRSVPLTRAQKPGGQPSAC